MKHINLQAAITLLLLSMLPLLASAYYDFKVNGICYHINSDGTSVTVTYERTSSPRYNNLSGSLTIPESVTYNGTTYSVTGIDYSAFESCSGLTSVTIPNSVTSIGDNAFRGCSGISELTWNAKNCSSRGSMPTSKIETLTIGNEVETLPSYLASESKITSVTIPNSVTSIGYSAFESCSGLTSVTIPNSVTSIGYSAFESCSGLTSVTIPNSVTFIGSSAFESCSGLTSVTIGNSVTSIGDDAFDGCSGISELTWNAKNCSSEGSMPTSKIETLTIGNEVERLPSYLASGSKITSVTIPNSVTSIGGSAFANCSRLTSVTIPNSVTSIGGGAFESCSGMTQVVWNAKNCSNFTSSSNPFSYTQESITNFIFGDSVQRIPSYLCYKMTKLTSISIPNSVTSIGDYAFTVCRGLTSVTIPNSVTSIGDHAFASCYGLTSVTIGNSVTSIGDHAFWYCSGLTSVTIPNSVTSIGGGAFDGCYGLTSVTIPNSVTSIGDNAFSWCRGLKKIYTEIENPQNVSYGSNVFENVPISCTIHVPMFTYSIYRQTVPWSAFCIVSDEANLVCSNASFSHTRGSESEVLDLPLELKNYVGVTGLQFDVTLPEYTSLQTAVLEASRIDDDHSIDLQQLYSDEYRILVTSPTNKTFKEGEGVLVHLGIKVPQLHDAGNKVVKFSNIILATDDEQAYEINVLDATLKLDYIVGDANADALVDAADYVVTARRIMGYSTATYYSDAANVNNDGSVNVTDLVGITNIALGIRPIERRQLPALMPNEQSAVHTAPALSATVQAQPDGNQVLLALDNEWAAAGMQMDVTLPAGVTVLKAELLGRAAGQQVDLAAIADGRVRVLVSSFSASDIAAGDDAILALTLDGLQDGMMTVSDIIVAERDLTTHELAPLSVALSTTGVSDLAASAGVRIWAENGSVVIESDEAGMAQLVMLNGMTQPLQVQPGRNTYPVAPGYYIVRLAGHTAKLKL